MKALDGHIFLTSFNRTLTITITLTLTITLDGRSSMKISWFLIQKSMKNMKMSSKRASFYRKT